ncbi:hypothetical protein ES288_D04G086700v1 [Gossypium darwinii]|uniref:Fatty acid hydroxylase domain-containing protein n=1 Tax=Gossypium darwinii TaxID=34276 RepID=A0A5D2CVB8_GOSDA|nr:hypothetical protein ES288_D04G086700v1 [Gossypium darwinii]
MLYSYLSMASKPGILTDWPWKPLGSFKYIILVPLIAEHIYSFMVKDNKDIDVSKLALFPSMLWRMLHNQLWISLSRYRIAKGTNKIVDKGIEFDQWGNKYVPVGSHVPYWRLDGVIITIALHHHYLYSRYHSHHHSSIVTEPITSVIHPFAEHIAYFLLFSIPILTTVLTGTVSVIALAAYVTYLDFMNNMGHCNFELIPNWLFTLLPPLKYIIYTPSFHSLHHVQFRTNYSLFMPFYDYIYGTMDKSSDSLYEKSLRRKEESPYVVHLTHLTTPESIYHLRLGFASFASKPYTPSTWHMWLLWPVTLCSMMLTWIYCSTFVVESNRFHNIILQTWAIPKYNIQYRSKSQKQSINNLIEEAILEAEEKGARVLSLGLMNQGEELNMYGGVYMQKHPQLKVKLVDGSSLAVAVVLNSIPKGTTQVVLRGKLTKVACALAFALCQKRIQVSVLREDGYEKLDKLLGTKSEGKLVLSKSYTCKTWLVGDGLSEVEQRKASKGTLFIPFSQFPPKKLRTDCFYHTTPAMQIPLAFENVDSCENWLPRRVMSIWRIAGLVHALAGWEEHECGYTTSNIEKVWEATLKHGFQPLKVPTHLKS